MRLSDLLRAKGRDMPPESQTEPDVVDDERIIMLDIELIRPNRYQPRQEFAPEPLASLAQSIQEQGLLQPIVVRRSGDAFELLMGERRLRACESLGWEQVPVIIRDVNDAEAAVVALIENLQREDLGLFEEIEGIQRLRDEFGMTQKEIAEMLGLSQSAVANKLRLLQLSAEVRDIISREKLSERHARALLQLGSNDLQLKAIHNVIDEGLNVKETEAWVKQQMEPVSTSPQQKRLQEKPSGMDKDARQFVNRVKRLIEKLAASGAEVEMQQSEVDGYIEVQVRIRTGKEH